MLLDNLSESSRKVASSSSDIDDAELLIDLYNSLVSFIERE